MLLQFENGEPYATGAAPYAYRLATADESSPRIILTILLGDIKTSAFVDTGGVYVVCSPEIAHQLELDPDEAVPAPTFRWRNAELRGVLHRVPLTILAEEGISLTIVATALIPQLAPFQQWDQDFPCVLGMSGCLERLRFAVDPNTDTFHFGELTQS